MKARMLTILFVFFTFTGYTQYTCEGFNPVDLEKNRTWIPEGICMNSLADYKSEVIDMMANHPGTNEEKYRLFHAKYFFCFLAKSATIPSSVGNCSHMEGYDLLRTATIDYQDNFLEEYEKMGTVFRDMIHYKNPSDGLSYLDWLAKMTEERVGAARSYYKSKLDKYSKIK